MPEIGKLQESEKQSEVSEQIAVLNEELLLLHDKLGKLSNRLADVLRPLTPESAPAESKDSQELVVLAVTIEGFGVSVKAARAKIDGMLNRLEL